MNSSTDQIQSEDTLQAFQVLEKKNRAGKSKNPIKRWAFTAWCDAFTLEQLITLLRLGCKMWVFQKEAAPTTGRLHFQGRISLKVKNRSTWQILPGVFTTPEHDSESSEFYCMKPDSRIEGPWSDRDPKAQTIPRQVREIGLEMDDLLPAQRKVVESGLIWDTRYLNCLIDEKGGFGKSALRLWMGCLGKAIYVPFAKEYKDIMRCVMCQIEAKGPDCAKFIIIDLPRAITLKQKLLLEFLAGVESLKDGYCFDDRYKFEDNYIDSPTIWLFCNHRLDPKFLSADRWKVWVPKPGVRPDSIPDDIVCITGNADKFSNPRAFKERLAESKRLDAEFLARKTPVPAFQMPIGTFPVATIVPTVDTRRKIPQVIPTPRMNLIPVAQSVK